MYALIYVLNILNTYLLILYYSYLVYGIALWRSTYSTIVNCVFINLKNAIRIVRRANYNEHSSPLFKQRNILKLYYVYQMQFAKYMFNMSKGTLPFALVNHITFNTGIHIHDTINNNNPHMTQRRTSIASKRLRHKGPGILYLLLNSSRHSLSKYL